MCDKFSVKVAIRPLLKMWIKSWKLLRMSVQKQGGFEESWIYKEAR